jgi:hypothetical protein
MASLGFKKNKYLGYRKKVADGPEKTVISVLVGYHPWNAPCISVRVGEYGMVLRNLDRPTLESLLSILEGVTMDHPCTM